MGGQQGNNQTNGGNSNMLFYAIVLLVVYVHSLFFWGKEDIAYSTTQTSSYKIPLKTTKFEAPFYVK